MRPRFICELLGTTHWVVLAPHRRMTHSREGIHPTSLEASLALPPTVYPSLTMMQDVRMSTQRPLGAAFPFGLALPLGKLRSGSGEVAPRGNGARTTQKEAAGPLHPAASPRCPEACYRSRSSSKDRAALRAADFASPLVMPAIEKPFPSLCPDTRKPVFTRL